MPVIPSLNLTNQQPSVTYTASVVTSGSVISDGLGNQITSLNVTASNATNAVTCSFFSGSISNAVSSSYALTSSFALNGGGGGTSLTTGSTYPITSSWANNSITSSFALNGVGSGTTLITASTYQITSSWALNAVTFSLITQSIAASSSSISSSWASSSLSSSYALTSSYCLNNPKILATIVSSSYDGSSLVSTASITPNDGINHTYRISGLLYCSSSNALAGNVTLFAVWTSLSSFNTVALCTANGTVQGDNQFGQTLIITKPNTPITYNAGTSGGTASLAKYNLQVIVESIL